MATQIKKSLTLLLQSYIETQTPLAINWECTYCRTKHSVNLLENVASISNDVIYGELKADIGLMTADNRLLVAIHISKNKKPTATALTYYQTQDVSYIQILPNYDYLASIQEPLYVGTCLNPKCENCGGFQHEKSMLIIDSKCWKCEGDMKIAVLECSSYHGGPDQFTEDELSIARSKGVIIENNYSKTVGHHYLSNTCPHCQMLSGNHFLFEHYEDAKYGYNSYQRIHLGYFCKTCHRNSQFKERIDQKQ